MKDFGIAGRPDRRDVLSLVAIAVAFGTGFWRAGERPPPSSFLRHLVAETRPEAPRFQSRFVTLRLGLHVHAACLVELGDARVRAFWYSGSREGALDVEIHTAVFDPARGAWGEETTVATPAGTQRSVLRYVSKVGNPASVRTRDGTLWLFYVTVSVGGWGGSAVNAVASRDDGETWGRARRLVSSPFLNLSTMVRGEPILYEDGTIGLPVYQNLVGSFGQLLRLDATGVVIDRHRIGDALSSVQPVVLVRSPTEALALLRNAGAERPNRVVGTATRDAGRSWTPSLRLPLRNPDAAVSGLVLPGGRILVALNDVEVERDALSLVVSDDGGSTWKTARQLEDQVASRELPVDDARYDRTVAMLARATDARVDDAREWTLSSRRFMCWEPRCHFEFSYPFLLQTRRGEIHLVYTWNRAFTKHVEFNQAWLDEGLSHAPLH
jgi:predicted neuraminidase